MFKLYFEMLSDCANFCAKADEFIKRQKEFMEGKDDGKDFKKLS